MNFLSPWFLSGLILLGLPLWLHLLRQFKRTPQPFSSLMFFERRVQSSIKHRRLRYLLLLALRMLLLALLALAFANPFVTRRQTLAGRRLLTVIAVDRSFSMRYRDHMARAKSAAEKAADNLPDGAFKQVLAVDSHVETLTQAGANRAAVKAAIATISADDKAGSFGELARALRVMDQSTGMGLRVILFSDMQQSGMPASFRDLQLGPHTTLELQDVGEKSPANWAVESVTTAPHVYAAPGASTGNTKLTATVTGWGTEAAVKRVSLTLDGRTVTTRDVTVPKNGRVPAEFLGFNVPYGAHRGEIRIEPQDWLPNDDVYPFSVERSEVRKVLFLYRNGRPKEALYYKAALESSGEAGLTVEAASAEGEAETDFTKYAFVVLNDLGDPGQSLAQRLCAYVSHGGAVLITLGPATVATGRVPLSGDSLTEARELQGAGMVDGQNPALLSAGRFENVEFLSAAHMTPKANAKITAKFADGSPLLVEETMGEGRELIFASSVDNSTSDFPLHASFVPFVVQTARYLAGAGEEPSSVVTETALPLRRRRDQGATASVIGPDGKHELTLAEAAKAVSYDAGQSGFYEVQRADGRRVLVAAHADRRESDLTPTSAETLDLWRNTGVRDNPAADGTKQETTQRVPLWRFLMVLGILAALVEPVFAGRYSQESSRPEERKAAA